MEIENLKTLDIREFVEKGYLQELNRKFLHPLGLAMSVKFDNTGEVSLGPIWDYRDDDEGIYYNLYESSSDRIKAFKVKAKFIEEETIQRNEKRQECLGFTIEPIGDE